MPPFEELGCSVCLGGAGLDFGFTMAFQPIVDARTRTLFAQEALVRGLAGEGAAAILARVTPANRYRFDQACRVKAIELAARAGLQCQLNINFLPNAVYRPESCIRTSLEAARTFGFPADRLCFEVVESEQIEDHEHVVGIIQEYRRQGLITAIDDFGAGYAGLNLLAEFQPDLLKLDMSLTRAIDRDRRRAIIVRSILDTARQLDIGVIAEGIETRDEYLCLRDMGVELFQGYYFARPTFEAFAPEPDRALYD
jgi:EAL domain-containing protein (putative c-di-GMP-specific phosphodiesterase class I)